MERRDAAFQNLVQEMSNLASSVKTLCKVNAVSRKRRRSSDDDEDKDEEQRAEMVRYYYDLFIPKYPCRMP